MMRHGVFVPQVVIDVEPLPSGHSLEMSGQVSCSIIFAHLCYCCTCFGSLFRPSRPVLGRPQLPLSATKVPKVGREAPQLVVTQRAAAEAAETASTSRQGGEAASALLGPHRSTHTFKLTHNALRVLAVQHA